MDFNSGFILFPLGFCLGVVLTWVFLNKGKNYFDKLSKEALSDNRIDFFQVAENKFGELLKSSDMQIDEKKKLIDSSLKDMKDRLEGLSKHTNELKTQMLDSRESIVSLDDTTAKLNKILDNTQVRGYWGEQQMETMLEYLGFVKDKHYATKYKTKSGKLPDYTFFLPKERRLNLDVKFPFENYKKLISSSSDSDKEEKRENFLKNVKDHIDKLAKKEDYIDTADGTLDFVLMFIPNEGIFYYLNKHKQGNRDKKNLVSYAMTKKVIMCSPASIFAILSMIYKSVQNFRIETKASYIQDNVNIFESEFEKFVEKLYKLGNSISAMSNHYDDLKGKRLNALKKPMDEILDLKIKSSDDEQIENDAA